MWKFPIVSHICCFCNSVYIEQNNQKFSHLILRNFRLEQKDKSNFAKDLLTKKHDLTVNNKIKPLHLITNKHQLNYLKALEVKKTPNRHQPDNTNEWTTWPD